MTLIDFFNQFWKVNKNVSFTPSEAYLYLYLLSVWNSTGRKESFICRTSEITSDLGLTKPTLIDCRKRLVKKGLITFKEGNRKAKSPCYSLVNFTNDFTNDFTINRVIRDKENIILSTHACEKNDYLTIDAIAPFLKSETFWISSVTERIYRNHKILLTSDEFNEWIDMYVLKLKTDGETSKFKDNAKSHFTNWLLIETGKKLKDERTAKNSKPSTRPNFDNFNEEEARQVGRINSIEL